METLRKGETITMRLIKTGAVLTALMAAAMLSPALAADGPMQRASVAVYSGGVDFLPNVAHDGAVLTVSGNGQTWRYEVGARERPSIGVFAPDGQLLADGTYTWELQLRPGKAAAKRLREAAAENGGRAPEPWTAQSGSFAIRGGFIADPALSEAQERTASGPQRGLRSSFVAGSFAARGPAEDDDDAVGSSADAEARVSAAAARRGPTAGTGVLQQPDRAPGDRSDAVTAALGRSLEFNNQQAAPSRRATAPRPRSDGSNGRPRS